MGWGKDGELMKIHALMILAVLVLLTWGGQVQAQSGGAAGSLTGPLATTGITVGECRILYMPVTFADRHDLPISQVAAQAMLREVVAFYSEASFGKLTMLPTVSPGITLPHSSAWYEQRDSNIGTEGNMDSRRVMHDHARQAVRKLGYDFNDYDIVILRQDSALTGNAATTGGMLWLGNNSAQTTAHEIGHILGLNHANAWNTSGMSTAGPGTDEEYAHVFDIMALASVPLAKGHFNVAAKSQLGWLPEVSAAAITQSGSYRIHAMDEGRLEPGKRHALKIVKDAQRTYWGEVRTLFDDNPWVNNGLVLAWNFPNGGTGNVHLLDTAPATPFGWQDAPLSLGRTFSDAEAGIHLTTVAVNESPRWVEVKVNLGDYSTNRAPVSSLTASAPAVPVGGTVTFTVTATDADGDELAYGWQHFGDAEVKVVSPNAAQITRTFTTAGSYVVACTVTDMKGGTSTRFAVVTVGGGGSRSVIRGRITAEGDGVGGLAVTANGTHGTLTDSDGYYAIPNLAAGSYVVTPLRHGYQFVEKFTNGVTVAPNFNGADFNAVMLPKVTLSAALASTNENGQGSPARFLLGRSGAAQGSLLVKLNAPQGSAMAGTDYVLTPPLEAAAPFQSVTIPDGETEVEISVTSVQDTVEEGTETVKLELVADFGYVTGNARATVEIADDDTVRQRVAVRAGAVSIIEGSAVEDGFVFTRTGDVSAALSVVYQVSGSAVAGVDYVAMSGSVVFVAGAKEVRLPVQMLSDAVAEKAKEIKVTVAATGSVIPDAGSAAAAILLVDDDLPTLSVKATRPEATEGGGSGLWVVSREGDASQELTVYYAVGGLATHGEDYQALPGVLTLPAGVTEVALALVPVADGWGEGDETVDLRLAAAPENYHLSEAATATVVIHDASSDKPTVGVMTALPLAEPSTHGRVTFMVTGTGPATLTVPYEVSGTATAGSDYSISGLNTTTKRGSVTLTLPAGGQAQTNVTVTVLDDAAAEDLESVTVTVLDDAAYQISALAPAATLWITDNEQPTVYVDAQVGTGATVGETVAENSSTPVALYFSRTGSLTNSLVVNYTVGGSATNGTDYATLTGSITIPAGEAGVVRSLSLTNDALVEGTETVEVTVASAAGYARGPKATIWITDDETHPQAVAFNVASSLANEGDGTVLIPVSLTSAATAVTRVDYEVDNHPTGSSTTSAKLDMPHWVRVVRTGNEYLFYNSSDGVTWSPPLRSNLTINMTAPSYLVGLCAFSGESGTAATAVFDNVSVTGLAVGGTVSGTAVSADVGTVFPAGSSSVTGGVYTLTGGGSGLGTYGTVSPDALRYTSFTVSNSTTCTLTARVVSISGGTSAAMAGVMFRESTAAMSRQVSVTALASGGSSYNYRASTTSMSYNVPVTKVLRPFWLAVQRQGNVINLLRSNDGQVWITTSSGLYKNLPPAVLVGLAASSKTSGGLTTGVFDQVSLEGDTVGPVNLGNATLGASNAGSYETAAGVHTLTGGGTGIAATADSFGFAHQEVTGDFMLKARLVSQTGGTAATAQAGVMMRESSSPTARMAYLGGVGSGATVPSFGGFSRNVGKASAVGGGVDYALPAGTLEFAVGEQVKNIAVHVLDDGLQELPETLTVTLKRPVAAALGPVNQHTLTIADNDLPPALASVGFAAAASSVIEGAGSAKVQVALSAASSSMVTVAYQASGGTATAGPTNDYVLESGSLTFQPGETVKTITITLINDAVVEPEETVNLTLSEVTGGVPGTVMQHTLTVQDDDLRQASLTVPNAVGTEAGDAIGFILSLSGPVSATDLQVQVAWGGTATPGADYATLPNMVTLPAGSSSVNVSVTPLQDTLNEGAETVTLTVVAGAGYGLSAEVSQQAMITDDDRSEVNLVASDAQAGESGDPGEWTLVRSGSLAGALQVNVSYTGTAVNGVDYATLPVAIPFADGQAVAVLPLSPMDDAASEGDEEAVAMLLPGTYDLGQAQHAPIVIADNDEAPVVRIISPTERGQIISASNGLIVEGVVWDDGQPQVTTVLWTQTGGPGAVMFDDATALRTGVTFSQAGVYGLRLSAQDGQFTAVADITVAVDDGTAGAWSLRSIGTVTNPAPTVTDSDGTITLSGAGVLDIAIVDPAYNTPSRGAFYARGFVGDFVATVRHGVASSTASRARSGLMLRASTDPLAAYAHVGRVPQSAYDGFLWRTTTNGIKDGVSGYAGNERWLRLVRRGNSVTAFQAPHVAGGPGAWVQIGPPQTVVLPDEILVGLFVDNNTGSGLNVVPFTDLTLTPLNQAPVVSVASPMVPAVSSFELEGTVTDDGQPLPAALSLRWSQAAGPGTMQFTAETALATAASVSLFGDYTVRLQAADGGVETFFDRTFTGYQNAFEGWLLDHFAGGPAHADADAAGDPDRDGISNLAEYALGLDPKVASQKSLTTSVVTLDGQQYLRLSVPRDPQATGVVLTPEIADTLGNAMEWNEDEVVIEVDTASLFQVRDALPLSARTRRFLRARFSLAED